MQYITKPVGKHINRNNFLPAPAALAMFLNICKAETVKVTKYQELSDVLLISW